MAKLSPDTSWTTLRYALMPDAAGIEAIEATLFAYEQMMRILEDVVPAGANLVALHGQAYERVRSETGLPARLVTLGLRDRAGFAFGARTRRLPLDEKLFAVKTPTTLTLSTVKGRVTIPFAIPGYSAGWGSPFQAQLVAANGSYEIHIAVEPPPHPIEEQIMVHEGILARMGRLIAAIASQTVDDAEGSAKIPLVKQAIREIDAGADEARTALGRSRAEEFRLKSRQRELQDEIESMGEKIRVAMTDGRDDLARAGVARQIDLESQGVALARALDFVEVEIEEQTKALQAMLGARREAEARLADLERSIMQHAPQEIRGTPRASKTAAAERAIAAISRVTGVPASNAPGNGSLDELDRLHREKAITLRLEQIRSSQ